MVLDSSDLVHTTESLRSAKLSAGKIEKECSNYDAIIEPYKTETAKLTRENNELHLEVLKLKEQSDHHIKGNIKITRLLKNYSVSKVWTELQIHLSVVLLVSDC